MQFRVRTLERGSNMIHSVTAKQFSDVDEMVNVKQINGYKVTYRVDLGKVPELHLGTGS